MKDGGGRQQWACDYCGEAAAALHCRADAARLCVACDRHVHAANALSRKHVRAPLCAGCAARPAAARVAAGGAAPAFLCADCDGGCEGAARVPVEGFSGCPAYGRARRVLVLGARPPPRRRRRKGQMRLCSTSL